MKENKIKRTRYKGPYQTNPNLHYQAVRKSMRTESDGPTVDTFFPIDRTTDIDTSDLNTTKQPAKERRRPTKERKKKSLISKENIIILIIGVLTTGIGIIVYNHSNRFVSVEKDIDYIKENNKEQKEQLHNVSTKINDVDKNVGLLNQKLDFFYKEKSK